MKIGRALRADFKSSLTPFPPTVLLERSEEAVESRKVPFLEQGQNLQLVRVVPCRALVGRGEQDQSHGHIHYQSRIPSHRFTFFLPLPPLAVTSCSLTARLSRRLCLRRYTAPAKPRLNLAV